MKKMMLAAVLFLLCNQSWAQEFAAEEPVEKGFKKQNLFTGGSLNLSFGNQVTALGLSPYFGYSINKYVDVAATLGWNYISQRDNIYNGDKLRQTILGPGAFVRLFPVKFLFAHAQYEHNFIRYKYIPPTTLGQPSEITHLNANSFLIGGGFASGRDQYNKSFYYISVLWDVSKDANSPYVDNQNRAVPLIRAGYHIALFQKSGQ